MAWRRRGLPRVGTLIGWTGRRSCWPSAPNSGPDQLHAACVPRLGAAANACFNRATLQDAIGQIIFTGVDALPLVTFLALAVGLSITSQMLKLGQALGSENDVATLLTNIVGAELSSLLTAIVLIGRSGSAIAVDLGSMKLRGEVEGLELLGINVERVLRHAAHHRCGHLPVRARDVFRRHRPVRRRAACGSDLLDAVCPRSDALKRYCARSSLLIFALKNLLFGIIIAGTACYHGLRVGTSPTELPQQTQRAIVTSLVLVFPVDGLLAVIPDERRNPAAS